MRYHFKSMIYTMWLLVFFCFSLPLLSAQDSKEDWKAEDHTLVGKPCPLLHLKKYMVQGESITQADFAGRVVYLDMYQPL